MFGIDISSNNGSIDWNLVAKNPTKVDFVFIKASEGVGYTDPKLNFNSTEAKRVGLKIGYYHFASLNTLNNVADAKSEAKYFMSVLKNMPKPDLPYILDLETNKVDLEPSDVEEWINTFFAELRTNGFTNVALYSYTPFLNSNLPVKHGLGNVKLWIAAYVNLATPKLPTGWSKYWIWQYSSKGTISGIKGNVDMNKTIDPIY